MTLWETIRLRETLAMQTEIGATMVEAGFDIARTGGGCMAWEKRADNLYAWITDDEGSDLGTDGSDKWLAGLYRDSDQLVCLSFASLNDAIAFANAALKAT